MSLSNSSVAEQNVFIFTFTVFLPFTTPFFMVFSCFAHTFLHTFFSFSSIRFLFFLPLFIPLIFFFFVCMFPSFLFLPFSFQFYFVSFVSFFFLIFPLFLYRSSFSLLFPRFILYIPPIFLLCVPNTSAGRIRLFPSALGDYLVWNTYYFTNNFLLGTITLFEEPKAPKLFAIAWQFQTALVFSTKEYLYLCTFPFLNFSLPFLFLIPSSFLCFWWICPSFLSLFLISSSFPLLSPFPFYYPHLGLLPFSASLFLSETFFISRVECCVVQKQYIYIYEITWNLSIHFLSDSREKYRI